MKINSLTLSYNNTFKKKKEMFEDCSGDTWND